MVYVMLVLAALAVSAISTAREHSDIVLNDGLSPDKTSHKKALTVWMTGISGSGKTTIAAEVVRRFTHRNIYRLDGDNLRKGLTSDLSFSAEDRKENNRRTAEVAKLFNDAGVIVICALISPFAEDRAFAREIHARDALPFMEVFVDAPLNVTEERDTKGLYALAREGKIKEFTGLTSPYEVPTHPDLHIKTNEESIEVSVQKLITAIEDRLKYEDELCSEKQF